MSCKTGRLSYFALLLRLLTTALAVGFGALVAFNALPNVTSANTRILSLDAIVVDAKTAGVLDFIGSIEAPAGYNAYSYYASSPPPKPLTTMTISEVLAWQERIDRTSAGR